MVKSISVALNGKITPGRRRGAGGGKCWVVGHYMSVDLRVSGFTSRGMPQSYERSSVDNHTEGIRTFERLLSSILPN